MEKRFGIEVQLVEGSRGVFEVVHGNDLVFSKKRLGRFPAEGEVEGLLAPRLAAG